MKPTIGRIVIYRTDGRNGLAYDLPAMITCTRDTHPGDYPDGSHNPLPVPDEGCVHLTVFSPGGYGSTVGWDPSDMARRQLAEAQIIEKPASEDFVGATVLVPGSGTYVEWNVPYAGDADGLAPDGIPQRTWRWPERVGA